MSNESRDHYHWDSNIVHSPLCGFSSEAAFQLRGLKLTISVCIRNATLRYNLSFFSLYLHSVVVSNEPFW